MGIGRALIVLGVLLIVAGLLFVKLSWGFAIRLPRLPGDILIRGKNGTFYFPIVTCLIVSVVLSALLWLIGRR